jgi:hypothetical protein
MVLRSGSASPAPSAITLAGLAFTFVTQLNPERDATGVIRELSPQGRYTKAASVSLHRHGFGTFCSFRISVQPGLAGVYALVVNGSLCYIGKCVDLGKRFNAGYGNISPKNCYHGGRTTNCKINRWVLDVTKSGDRVSLYFHQTPQRHIVEKRLIANYTPPWNGHSDPRADIAWRPRND